VFLANEKDCEVQTASDNAFRLYRECAGEVRLESRVALIAGALPIQRIELSRYLRAYGDWFPNCRMSGRYLLSVGRMFGGGMRHCLPPSMVGLTVRAIFAGANKPPKHTSAVPASGSFIWVRNVVGKNHQVMRSPTLGLLGTPLPPPSLGAPSRSHGDGQLCRLGRVDGAAPLS